MPIFESTKTVLIWGVHIFHQENFTSCIFIQWRSFFGKYSLLVKRSTDAVSGGQDIATHDNNHTTHVFTNWFGWFRQIYNWPLRQIYDKLEVHQALWALLLFNHFAAHISIFSNHKTFFAHNVAEFHSVIDVANKAFQESAHVHNALFDFLMRRRTFLTEAYKNLFVKTNAHYLH